MKRIFFSFLACWMFASAFAQPEISKKNIAEVLERWMITPVSTMKGVPGILNINFLPRNYELVIGLKSALHFIYTLFRKKCL